MRLLYSVYRTLGSGLFIFLFPVFLIYTRITGRRGRSLKERLGFISSETVQDLSGSPRVWIHAASLGEVKVASSIVEALKQVMPECSVILSTITQHGRKLAEEIFREEIPVFFAPLDFVISVRKALITVRPDIVIFIETEIWPAWLFETHRLGIKTALINGRISKRSIGGYLRLRPFFREVLKSFDVLSMITKGDAARIRAMGADPNKIEINGNAKYDFLRSISAPDIKTKIGHVLNLNGSSRVFIAGSTRKGEESIVLDAYRKILEHFSNTILIIAPRHIDRTPEIGALVKNYGLEYQLWTDLGQNKKKRTMQVVIINTFGELFNIYSIGTIIFCGASLVPLGGQNPLEPAAWGKVVFYGPSMEDFSDARSILEAAGAGVCVSGSEMMAREAIRLLGNKKELERRGELACEMALRNQGAAESHARVIKRLWISEKGAE